MVFKGLLQSPFQPLQFRLPFPLQPANGLRHSRFVSHPQPLAHPAPPRRGVLAQPPRYGCKCPAAISSPPPGWLRASPAAGDNGCSSSPRHGCANRSSHTPRPALPATGLLAELDCEEPGEKGGSARTSTRYSRYRNFSGLMCPTVSKYLRGRNTSSTSTMETVEPLNQYSGNVFNAPPKQ